MNDELEIVSRAASFMRLRAEAALWDGYTWRPSPTVIARADTTMATCAHATDAEHIAGWPPRVAMAVADWLDSVASAMTSPDEKSGAGRVIAIVDQEAALRIACAYLELDL